jgi:hypothetical protein
VIRGTQLGCHPPSMRIGTWNLAGRWSDAHRDLLLELDCDVLLLTEVNDRLELADYSIHRTTARFAPKRTWAAVATRAPMATRPDPHPATALVTSGGWTFASTVLPWGGCGPDPWGGGGLANQTQCALDALLPHLRAERLIWGGDWNNALQGAYAGARAARAHVLRVVADLGLGVPTALLPHRIDGLLSIDHVAIPSACGPGAADHVRAIGLSDHDAYVVEIEGSGVTQSATL